MRSGRVLLVTCAIGIAGAHLRGQPAGQSSVQASADGAAVFMRRCASCHEGTADERAPSRTALRDRMPQQVLDALTNGVMTAQGSTLTDAERRAVAEFLTGRAVGSGSTIAGRGGSETVQELSPEQLRLATTRDTPVRLVPLPNVDRATSRDWPLHNLDLANSRYSPLKQINASNIKSVTVKWLYHTRNAGSTPIVVDGVMYIATSDQIVALDATTGRPTSNNTEASHGRGAAYGDGKIYVAKDARIWALDAKTGKPVEGFGKKGVSYVLSEVLKAKYPQLEKPADWGYSFNMAPQYYDRTTSQAG